MEQFSDDDVVSPLLYSDDAKLHRMFADMRTNNPVRWINTGKHRPFWAISRHRDIIQVETETEIFLAGQRNRLFTIEEEERSRARTGGDNLLPSIPTLDEPDHRKYRGIFQQWFAPANLRKLENRIATIVDDRLEHARTIGAPFDFIEEVSLWVPLQTIMSIFGVPYEDGYKLHRLSAELFNPYDPDRARKTDGDALAESAGELFEYFSHHIAKRRTDPQDDLLSIIAHARIDDQPIAENLALSNAVTVFIGGHDTTVATISGGLDALINHPDAFAAMKDGSANLPHAVEEMLRYVSPVRGFMRQAASDYQLNDTMIRAGDGVLLFYPSGNRDETVFEDADTFRLDRGKTNHLAFGCGPHMCLGQMLARLELRSFYAKFFEKVADVERVAPTRWIQSNFLGGPKEIMIDVTFR